MTTTTDLLRRAAELLRKFVATYAQVSEDEPGGYCSPEDAEMDSVAASLLALAESMERAEPVANENAPPTHDFNVADLDFAARKWAHEQGMTDDTKLYVHPAPDVQRDAAVARIQAWAQLHEPTSSAWSEGYEDARGWVRMQLEAMQEPKP